MHLFTFNGLVDLKVRAIGRLLLITVYGNSRNPYHTVQAPDDYLNTIKQGDCHQENGIRIPVSYILKNYFVTVANK